MCSTTIDDVSETVESIHGLRLVAREWTHRYLSSSCDRRPYSSPMRYVHQRKRKEPETDGTAAESTTFRNVGDASFIVDRRGERRIVMFPLRTEVNLAHTDYLWT